MIIKVNGVAVRLEPEAQAFIESLSERTGTPEGEILAAIVNGHMGGSI